MILGIIFYLIDDGGFQIDEDGTGDVFTGAGLGEKGVERINHLLRSCRTASKSEIKIGQKAENNRLNWVNC